METYTTNEGMVHCSNCGAFICAEGEPMYGECSSCWQIENADMSDSDDDCFDPCSDCDLPDACADFGCAIKAGLRKPNSW